MSIRRQCALLGISRSSVYYTPRGESPENLALMRRMDELSLQYPFYGSRQMARHLQREGVAVGRRRVRRLRGLMGLEALYRKPRTSGPQPGHRIYPYLLRDLTIDRPNQVWCADITYIPVSAGFLYLVAIMDWASRHVLAWRLSNTMEPLAKLLGLRLGSVLPILGVNIPIVLDFDCVFWSLRDRRQARRRKTRGSTCFPPSVATPVGD